MTPDEYISVYGASLSEADKRYIRAFGAPTIPTGQGRNPYTPGLRIADASSSSAEYAVSADFDLLEETDERMRREQQDMEDEEDAAAFGAL